VTGRQLQTADWLDDGTDILDPPTPLRAGGGEFAHQAITTGPATRVAWAVVRPGEPLLCSIKRRPSA